MDCFTFLGEYSVTDKPACIAAAIATPCARPSFSILCTFLPKNGASIAKQVGLYSCIIEATLLCIFSSRSYASCLAFNFKTPISNKVAVLSFTFIMPYPITIVPGSIPKIIFVVFCNTDAIFTKIYICTKVLKYYSTGFWVL